MGMSDKEMIFWVVLMFASLVIGIFIVCVVKTRGSRRFNKMKNPRKILGTVTKREYFSGGYTGDSYTDGFYEIDYSFCDDRGVVYQNHFSTSKELFHQGDEIVVYYDAERPQDNIAEEDLKCARENYWKIPLAGLAFILVPVILCLLLVLFSEIYKSKG